MRGAVVGSGGWGQTAGRARAPGRILALLMVAGVTACGESPGREEAIERPGTGAGVAEDTAVPPPADSPVEAVGRPGRTSDLRGYDTVFVFFDGPLPEGEAGGPLVPRPRPVPDTADAMRFALRELLKGPSPADEAAAGPLDSWFSGETGGMLRSVTVDEGLAVIDFEDFRPVVPGASSSAGSAMLLRQVQATAFQFPGIDRLELRIGGDCEALMAWLQIGCVPLPRSSFGPVEGARQAVPGDTGA